MPAVLPPTLVSSGPLEGSQISPTTRHRASVRPTFAQIGAVDLPLHSSSAVPRVFISYRREDAQAFARGLYNELSRRYGDENVFRDIDAIQAGARFTDVIEEGVGNANILIVIISRSWASARGRRRLDDPGDVLRREVEIGLRRGISIIPVCVEGARLPTKDELGPALDGLLKFTAIEISDARWDHDIARLANAIDGHVTRGSATVSALLGAGPKRSSVQRDDSVEGEREDVGWRSSLATSRPPVVPRQLPGDAWRFVGRKPEIDALTEIMNVSRQQGGAVLISAIEGTAGIGKTALALHWAHSVSDRFPDGQLYVNLRGFDPTGLPMEPQAAIRLFLDALEVPPDRIPLDLAGQSALYRSIVADRTILVVLDNAISSEQVRPLLPGTGSCITLVTSRNRLDGIVIYNHAQRINLDAFTADEAYQLLAAYLGREPVAEDVHSAQRVLQFCARLPLALNIVCARAVGRSNVKLAQIADELADERRRLDILRAGESSETDLRAVFSWSYQQLDDERRKIFRVLGVHPGPEVGVGATSALLHMSAEEARVSLDELTRTHLLEEYIPGRWRFHDLLRVYSAERAEVEDTSGERMGALRRVFGWYLAGSGEASSVLMPQRRRMRLSVIRKVQNAPDFESAKAALEWCEVERGNLLAVIREAARIGENTTCAMLVIGLSEFWYLRAHWADWEAAAETSLKASQLSRDMLSEAWTLASLGTVNWCSHRFERGFEHLHRARELFRALGDQAGEAYVLSMLGNTYAIVGQFDEARETLDSALALSRTIADQWCEGLALLGLGNIARRQERLEMAVEYVTQSLIVRRTIGDHWGEAFSLQVLGEMYQYLGNHALAIEHLSASLALRRDVGDRGGTATTLAVLGDAYYSTDQLDLAEAAWQEALETLEQINAAEVDELQEKLQGLHAAGKG